MMQVKPIPAGYHAVTPALVVRGASRALDWYKKVFGAEELYRMEGPGGTILHAELKIGDSIVMLGDELPEMNNRSPKTLGGAGVSLMLYTKDCDAVFHRALQNGAESIMQLQNMFWGDRYGKLVDPFGHSWGVATHIENVSPEEMKKRQAAYMSGSKK